VIVTFLAYQIILAGDKQNDTKYDHRSRPRGRCSPDSV